MLFNIFKFQTIDTLYALKVDQALKRVLQICIGMLPSINVICQQTPTAKLTVEEEVEMVVAGLVVLIVQQHLNYQFQFMRIQLLAIAFTSVLEMFPIHVNAHLALDSIHLFKIVFSIHNQRAQENNKNVLCFNNNNKSIKRIR